jgi:Tol biopolymer transport system component
MMKFDPATKAQSAFLPQVFSDMVSFSKDGRTLAYSLSDQEQTLWVSQSDGTSAHRLIPPPVQTAFPQWSPDGTRIAVATRRPGEAWRISLVSPGFGEVTELKLIKDNALHPSWSPDGKTILFGTIPTLEDNAYLYTVDLVSSRVSQVPGSKGLFTPMWSPDGRFIVAIEAKSYRLVLLDRATGVWSTITDTKSGYPIWSPDGKDIYSVLVLKKGVYLCRIQPLTRHVEPIIDLGAFRIIDRWIGLHPDGSFLVPKNDSVQEIFALDLQPPLSSRLF